MRYYLIACVFAAFCFTCLWGCGVASAKPRSDNAKVRGWISQMDGWVPMSSIDVEVKVGFCPGLDPRFTGGCYDGVNKIIWASPDDLTKDTIGHEIGHAFDDQVMNDGNRNKIINRFFHLYGTIWMPEQGLDAIMNCPGQDRCPNEMFADGFSACARHVDSHFYRENDAWALVGSYGLEWTKSLQKHLCAFIDKVGSKAEAW